MSGKVSEQPGEHGNAITEGVLTALSWLTILPVRGATAFDRITGARVMASMPVVGAVFGASTAAILLALTSLSVPAFLIAVIIVAFWEMGNRFMHLDGLADVADALGSYAQPARAREILADSATGLIGMAAALFSVLVQVAAITTLIDARSTAWLVCWIPVISRLAGMVLARRGRAPLSPTGFGAMLIGTVVPWWIAAWWVVTSISGVLTGNLAVAWIPGVTALLMIILAEFTARHFSRRFEGVNGDCIGAIVHITAAAGAAVMAITASAVTTLL